LQGVTSIYLGYTYNNLSILSTIYPLIAILILNPYFENKKKYLLLLLIFGLIIDITYTNTLGLNVCLFLICYYFNQVFHFFFPYNWFTTSISNLISIFIYHIISFLLLTILKYDIYILDNLTEILKNSVLMTVIYSNLIYMIITFIYQKFQLKEIK